MKLKFVVDIEDCHACPFYEYTPEDAFWHGHSDCTYKEVFLLQKFGAGINPRCPAVVKVKSKSTNAK